MKIIYQGDIHLRDRAPANRVDDYDAAQWEKLAQLTGWANEYEAPILLGGDLFDTSRASIWLVNKAIMALQNCDEKIYSVAGQHDVPYHRADQLIQSPLYTLFETKALTMVLSSGSHQILTEGDHILHFVSWEQTPTAPVPGFFNIFLGHVSVFEGQVPFYWKGEAYTPKTLRKKYPGFDLYLCGDIHSPLVDGNVVVSGPMMRMGIDHIDYRPRCYLIDTETMNITPLYYEIKEDVFSIPDEKFKTSLELDSLVMAMKMGAFGKDSFKRDCLALSQSNKDVQKIIEEIFDGLD